MRTRLIERACRHGSTTTSGRITGRIGVLALAFSLAWSSSAVAQDPTLEETRNEAVYQGLWCLYLHASPFILDAPTDVTCDYETRPMTLEEAGAFYQRLAQESNYIGYQRRCAGEKSKRGYLSWKQLQKWTKRSLKASKKWDKRVRAVVWPEEVQRKITRYLDLGASEDFAMKQAYKHKTLARSVSSGDWAAYLKANDKRANVSQQLRKALRLPDLPIPSSGCKAMKRYEARLKRQQEGGPLFDNPFEHPDIRRVANLLAALGMIETRPNDAGEPALYLTDAGLATARSLPAIGDEATPAEVAAGLFTPVATPAPPSPSPSPEAVELVLPE